MLAAWPGGSWQDTVWLVVALLVAYGVVFWLSTLVWVYRDIKGRTNDPVSQFVSVAMALIFPMAGLVLYLILRPQETLTDAMSAPWRRKPCSRSWSTWRPAPPAVGASRPTTCSAPTVAPRCDSPALSVGER
jgi:hypothetical protein